jgi:formylglycine-generating enzyme required for sulfatase activity
MAEWQPVINVYIPVVQRTSQANSQSNTGLQIENGSSEPQAVTYSGVTNGEGYYTISDLPIGSYTLVPIQESEIFSPTNRLVNLPPSASSQDFTCTTCGSLVLVPEGTFLMGCDSSHMSCLYYSQLPLHTVTLSAYAIDKYEVSNQRYATCVAAEHCRPPSPTESATRSSYYGNPMYANYPVVNLDWDQARAFCEWDGKRLPTEAEWEKAARGSNDTRAYPWGNADPTCALVNFTPNDGPACVGDTEPVNSHPDGRSPYGAYNMAGNVREWVSDWYDPNYYSISPPFDPTGPATGSVRVVRGGSWDDSNNIGVVPRKYDDPYDCLAYQIGFRCVRSGW